MPHPARSFPQPCASPWFRSGRNHAAERAGGLPAHDRPAASPVFRRIRFLASKAADTRRERRIRRHAGERGGPCAASRTVRGRRARVRHPPATRLPHPRVTGPPAAPLETPF
jgi:hypothetical protein